MKSVDLQGHRGARALRPENTLPAFEHALEIGVTTLELDIGMTRDGVLVVHHDRRLNPAIARDMRRGGAWISAPGPLIHALSAAELAQYDVGRIDPSSAYARRFPRQQPRDGTGIPSLAELFSRVRTLGDSRVRFNIETKIDPGHPADTAAPEEMTRALITAIRAAGLESRATIQSFDWRTLRLAQAEAAEITTVYLSSEQPGDSTVVADGGGTSAWTAGLDCAALGGVVRMVQAAGGRVWSPDFRDLSEEKARLAAALGIRIVPWTVNEEDDLNRVLDLGVDGLIADDPGRAAALIRRRGLEIRGLDLRP